MNAVVETRARLSRRLLAACAEFGLEVRRAGGAGPRRPRGRARRLLRRLRAGDVALITGPSGSGKTTLLRELARQARAEGRPVIHAAGKAGPARSDRSVLDLVAARTGCGRAALRLLARAGLADARVLPRRRNELSAGQRTRLDLAIAMSRAEEQRDRALLVIDEFGSVLDRPAARGLAVTVSRWARRSGVTVVCATAHGDVGRWMRAAVLVEMSEP